MSSNDQKHNGWTNYETWVTNLWFDDTFTEEAQYAYDDAEADEYFSREERATLALADNIEDTVREFTELAETSGLATDLIGAALSSVNW